ncbi:MAG: lipoprotein-releasing system transrane protein LolC [Hyphomicrobiales bacterium]|nr:lipoprotein-releasing system transrane protein LolC [Hyphomicrobiales bacterium]
MSGMRGLVFSIALTHIRARMRQTLVGVMGVAIGVGFSVMMAALMEGSQNDFVAQLVDSLPHISVTDEQREPPRQPADIVYDAAEIHGLTTRVLRPGIKNPFAIMAALEGWLPGTLAPSVQWKAVIRFAGRDTAASVTGIDPRREMNVSKLPTQIRSGSLDNLFKASNAIILGDGLAKKIGARVGNSIVVTAGSGNTISATVVALSHSGVSQVDDTQSYVLIKTGQILAGQTGLVNELRVKVRDVMQAREVARRIEAETGYKSVSWQEAHEDLLSAFQVRNIIMYTVVSAILMVASFGTYNIISTITHEKTRDIAIMKSLGFASRVIRQIFVVESMMIGVLGLLLGWVLGVCMTWGMGFIEIKSPFMDSTHLPVLYAPAHYVIAGLVALSASVIAGYFPARKAASLQPVEIIRGAS